MDGDRAVSLIQFPDDLSPSPVFSVLMLDLLLLCGTLLSSFESFATFDMLPCFLHLLCTSLSFIMSELSDATPLSLVSDIAKADLDLLSSSYEPIDMRLSTSLHLFMCGFERGFELPSGLLDACNVNTLLSVTESLFCVLDSDMSIASNAERRSCTCCFTGCWAC